MKAEEFRLGNYYKWYAEGKEYFYKIEGRDFTNNNYKNFEPIELTEEILLKCGFEKSAWDNYSTFINLFCSDGYIVISLEHKYVEIGDLTLDIEIKHLNHLQNLYWCLCGKELNVNM